jgi:hypothetical protein
MTTERHLDDISIVIGANIIGWIPTMLEWEELFRLAGLVLAAVYTALKIIDWFQDRRKK